MTIINPFQNSVHRNVQHSIAQHWPLFLAQGVALVILGCIALALPAAATLAVDFYLGWLFLIGGLVGLFAVAMAYNSAAILWGLASAALAMIAGLLLLTRPGEGTMTLTLILTGFFVAEGIVQIIAALAYRHVSANLWLWMLASGLADLVLAAIVIRDWPASAAWMIGLLAGINLLSSGAALVMMALAGRNMATQP